MISGGYEIISGHRRHRASELAGKETMPVIVRDKDDDAAIILMVDANLQRETILPSERAFAYKLKLDAMRHQAGRPSEKNYSQVGNNFGKTSSEEMAEELGTSKNQIFRYIRLTELIPEILDGCKQSFRACLVACPHYSSKRSKICEDKGAKNAE